MAFDDELRLPQDRPAQQDLLSRIDQTEEGPSGLERVALATAGVVGGLLLGRKVLQNSEAALRAVGSVSNLVRNILYPARAISRGFMDMVAGARTGRPSMVENLPFLDRVSHQLEIMRRARAAGATSTDLSTLRKAALDGFSDWGYGSATQVGSLRRLTVGDILQTGYSDARRALSPRARAIMQEGVAEGVLGHGMAVTGQDAAGLYIGANGKVIDARVASPAFWAGIAERSLQQLRVPFTNIRPINILMAPFRPFGRGAFAGEVGQGLHINPDQVTPDGVNFVIGGQLYSNASGYFRPVEGMRGIKLGHASSAVAQARFFRYGEQPVLGDYILGNRLAAGGSFLDRAQFGLGIGAPYRTQEPFWKKLYNVVQRRDQGHYYPFPYVQRRFNQSPLQNAATWWQARAAGIDPESALGEAVTRTRAPTFFDKIRAHLDISRRGAIVQNGVVNPKSYQDLVVPPLPKSQFVGGYHNLPAGVPQRPTGLGDLSSNPLARNQHYAYQGSFREAFADVTNMFTTRLNDLVGYTTGLGFRPSTGGVGAAGVNLLKLYGIYAGGQAALGYAAYADSLIEKVNPFGNFGARKAALALYAGLRVAHQSLRELFGIAPAARYAEDLMPKSMDSAFSWVGRTIAPLAIGLARGGKAGMLKGALVAAAIGGDDLGQRPSELIEEYKGERLVPMRRARWWMLGRQPWEGGQIDYYAPGWFARQMSDYRYTSTQYGTKGEYYSHVANIDLPIIGHVPLPTPHNLFGLIPFLDGDFFGGGQNYLADKHRADRPYPDTPGMDYEAAVLGARGSASRGPYDPPVGAGQRLGMGTGGDLGPELGEQRGMMNRIAMGLDQISELGGVYKFFFNTARDMAGYVKPPSVASASAIGDTARQFYDEQLGGMLGLTELYRRFVPPPEKTINPIPNTMPDWMPGTRSVFQQDRVFGTDFTRGDPYTKIKHGEFRLPGEAYETLHRLHSGTPGVYDAMDRFLILADIAPNSESYKHYKTIVEGWSKTGVLDVSWAKKFGQTLNQVQEKMKRYDFVDRRFTGLITDPNPDKTAGKYNFLEKALGGGWEMLTHDLIPRIGDTVPIFGPILADKMLVARSPVEQYERSILYGEEFADWKHPWRSFLRPKLNLLASRDPLTAVVGGLGLGALGANPVAALAFGAAGGITAGTMSLSKPDHWIPQHRENEWALQEYMDNLRYAKSRILGARAEEMGDQELVQYYRKEGRRTVTGVDYTGNSNYFIARQIRAMPTEFKGFVVPFMQMPQQAKDYIYPYLPKYMQPVFAAGWTRSGAQGYKADAQEMMNLNPDQRAARFFNAQGGLPDADWAGWHPDVPLDAVAIKMVDTGTNSTAADIHRFSLSNEHRFRAERFPGLDIPVGSINPSQRTRVPFAQLLNNAGFDQYKIIHGLHTSEDDSDSISWRVLYDRGARLRDMVSEVMR